MFGAFVAQFWELSSDDPDGPCSQGRECPVCVELLRIWVTRALAEKALKEMGR